MAATIPLYETRSREAGFAARDEAEAPVIEGYFVVFGDRYEICPGELETVAPTAFDDLRAEDDIRALVDHNTRLVLGRSSAGTLELAVDAHGLFGRIKINRADSDAMNLYARVQRGDVTQCSFGFDILEEDFAREGPDVLGTIRRVKLYEVSVVTFPAYAETSVEARSAGPAAVKFRTRRLERWREEMIRRIKHGT